MRIPRIYTSQALSENSTIELNESAAHYVANVLRMKSGCELILFNGEGGEYKATLTSISKKKVSAEVNTFENVNPESPLSIELGFCLIKNDRMDWLIQKATELGITKISPLISVFTDTKLPPNRYPKKKKHWQQVAESACQQSGRTRLPELEAPQPATEWLVNVEAESKFVLHPYQAKRFDGSATAKSIALLVGPEGGFSDTEIDLAHAHHFSPVSLGSRVLRAETAPLAALTLLQYHWGDL